MSDLSALLAKLVSEAIASQDDETQARLRAALHDGAEVLVRRSPQGIVTVRIAGVDVLHADLATVRDMSEPWTN